MICQHALSHLNVCICHVMVQKLCFLMHFWLVVLLLGICKCVCVMHCHRQMISLQTFYKWFFFQCSHGKKKKIAFSLSGCQVYRKCSLLYVYISLAVITKSLWNNAGGTGVLLQAVAFWGMSFPTACGVCVISQPHAVTNDQRACLCNDQGVFCVWGLVLFIVTSSSLFEKGVCYDSSSIFHLFYVRS